MDCPRDGTSLEQVERQQTPIDVCSRCHGIWLDQGELERLILSGSRSAADPADVQAAMASAERPNFLLAASQGDELVCPRCNFPMQAVTFQSRGASVTADRCDNCQGFWLDQGEAGTLFVFLESHLPARRHVWAFAAGLIVLAAVITGWLLAS